MLSAISLPLQANSTSELDLMLIRGPALCNVKRVNDKKNDGNGECFEEKKMIYLVNA